jgi:hypothetical protein
MSDWMENIKGILGPPLSGESNGQAAGGTGAIAGQAIGSIFAGPAGGAIGSSLGSMAEQALGSGDGGAATATSGGRLTSGDWNVSFGGEKTNWLIIVGIVAAIYFLTK